MQPRLGQPLFTPDRADGEVAQSTFVFKQEGEKLTGSYSGPLWSASVTGTAKGDQAAFGFIGKNESG